jgi:chromosome partitioning protein
VLIPVQPRGLDVWALGAIAGLVDGARATRDGLRALAVINLADPGVSADNADATAALSDFPALERIDVQIVRRKAFANAAAHGLSIDELAPSDPRALQELDALVKQVFSHQYAMETP